MKSFLKGKVSLFLLLIILPFQKILPEDFEVGISSISSGGVATVALVEIYVMNQTTHELEYYDGGYTFNWFKFHPIQKLNGAFDINDNNTDSTILGPLPGGYGVTYFIKMGQKYYKMEFYGGSGYGDLTFEYISDKGIFTLIDNFSEFTVTGPFDWAGTNITISNDFGLDASQCFGNIYFNSQLIENLGSNGRTFNRKGGTFPQTATIIDNQIIREYKRVWTHWTNETQQQYLFDLEEPTSVTAYYKKELDVNITCHGGIPNIKINGSPISLPSSGLHFYDREYYVVEAFDNAENSLSSTFSYWKFNGNNIYQNQLSMPNPASHINLEVHYTTIPLFTEAPDPAIRNLSISQIHNVPVTLTWSEHPSSYVTKYRIYRKVKVNSTWSGPVLIGTVNRGTTTFEDPDYIYQRGMGNLLMYDVRAYCDSFFTESSELFQGPYNGVLYKKNSKENGQIVENSISNYPNPFNPVTKISFSIKENGMTKVQVYDILGNKVADLVSEYLTAGSYEAPFDASRLPSGTYIYTIKSNNYSAVKKMLLVK